jgi:hypothetical protein
MGIARESASEHNLKVKAPAVEENTFLQSWPEP